MAYDLILKKTTRKSWARDDVSYKPLPADTSTAKVVPTPEELARVRELTALRARAEAGDAKARKEWRVAHTKVVALRVRARGGDPKAKRACQVLEEGGVFGKSQKPSVSGEDVKSAAELCEKARRGDVKAQEAFRKLAAKAKGTPEGREILDAVTKAHTINGEFVGRQEIMGAEEIMGEFVGDEERMSRDAGPAERDASARISGALPFASRILKRSQRQKSRRLRKLAWRAARGDAKAASKLQAITSRLQQRSSAGNVRATALLQQVQSLQAQAQAQVAQQQVAAPPAAPAPAADVTYSAPYASTEESEYEEEY